MELGTILNSPVTIVTLLLAAGLLQRSGVDVVGLVKWFFSPKLKGSVENGVVVEGKTSKDWFDGIEQQLSLITTNHFDHVQKSLDGLHEKHDQSSRTNDRLLYILEDLRSNGVKCRKE